MPLSANPPAELPLPPPDAVQWPVPGKARADSLGAPGRQAVVRAGDDVDNGRGEGWAKLLAAAALFRASLRRAWACLSSLTIAASGEERSAAPPSLDRRPYS